MAEGVSGNQDSHTRGKYWTTCHPNISRHYNPHMTLKAQSSKLKAQVHVRVCVFIVFIVFIVMGLAFIMHNPRDASIPGVHSAMTTTCHKCNLTLNLNLGQGCIEPSTKKVGVVAGVFTRVEWSSALHADFWCHFCRVSPPFHYTMHFSA